jgi:hypothetical protein
MTSDELAQSGEDSAYTLEMVREKEGGLPAKPDAQGLSPDDSSGGPEPED